MSNRETMAYPSRARRTREEGQTMAEYAVVLTVITIGIVTAFAVFSSGIEQSFMRVVDLIPG